MSNEELCKISACVQQEDDRTFTAILAVENLDEENATLMSDLMLTIVEGHFNCHGIMPVIRKNELN